jgi:hypothetical protein
MAVSIPNTLKATPKGAPAGCAAFVMGLISGINLEITGIKDIETISMTKNK